MKQAVRASVGGKIGEIVNTSSESQYIFAAIEVLVA